MDNGLLEITTQPQEQQTQPQGITALNSLSKIKTQGQQIEVQGQQIEVQEQQIEVQEQQIEVQEQQIEVQEQQNLPSIFMNVAQGCYAIINENTPDNIKGLLTTGLNVCTCIIITDSEHKNIVLSHVDGNHTNLLDPDYGLKNWIEQIPGNNIEIQIHLGVKKLKNPKQSEFYNNIYKSQINEIIKLLPKNKTIKIIEHEHEHAPGMGGAFICRNGLKIEDVPILTTLEKQNNVFYGNNSSVYFIAQKLCNSEDEKLIVSFDKINIIMGKDFLENERNLESYNEARTIFTNTDKLEKETLLVQLTYKIYGEKNPKITDNMPLPPICCYNGSGQPKNIQNIQEYLNNEYGTKIDQYATQMNSIYKENPKYKDDNLFILEKFKLENIDIIKNKITKSVSFNKIKQFLGNGPKTDIESFATIEKNKRCKSTKAKSTPLIYGDF